MMRMLAVMIFLGMIFLTYNSCGQLSDSGASKDAATSDETTDESGTDEEGTSPDSDPEQEAGSTTEPGGEGAAVNGVCGVVTLTGEDLSALVVQIEKSTNGVSQTFACPAAQDACATIKSPLCSQISQGEAIDCSGEQIKITVKENNDGETPACPFALVVREESGSFVRRYPVGENFDRDIDLDTVAGQYLCLEEKNDGGDSGESASETVCEEQQVNCAEGEQKSVSIANNDGDGAGYIYWECE